MRNIDREFSWLVPVQRPLEVSGSLTRLDRKRALELGRREANALRRLLNRHGFAPQDVAQLGLPRGEAVPGLGATGLAHVLPVPAIADRHEGDRQDRINRRLEQVQQLLEQWGWQLRRPAPDHALGDQALMACSMSFRRRHPGSSKAETHGFPAGDNR